MDLSNDALTSLSEGRVKSKENRSKRKEEKIQLEIAKENTSYDTLLRLPLPPLFSLPYQYLHNISQGSRLVGVLQYIHLELLIRRLVVVDDFDLPS